MALSGPQQSRHRRPFLSLGAASYREDSQRLLHLFATALAQRRSLPAATSYNTAGWTGGV